MSTQILITILAGCALLLFGRRLFWLFVGALGFASGLEIGMQLFHGQTQSTIFIGALILGIVGIILALFLQKLAIGIAGFVAGSYLTLSLLHLSNGSQIGSFDLIITLIGGLIGFMLMRGLFEWTMIALSSLLGAHLIVFSIPAIASFAIIIFVFLSIVGILFQTNSRHRRNH